VQPNSEKRDQVSDQELFRIAEWSVAEPLVNSWAVWADALSPVPQALHLANYQLPLLRSFLSSPNLHAEGSANPELAGGSFIDLLPARLPEVHDLLRRCEQTQSSSLDLARAVRDFSCRLLEWGCGQSLEPLYSELPEPLRGVSELVYDYHNRPTLRLIEALLYRSRYYRRDLQELRFFAEQTDSARPFFLNTPRLQEANEVRLAVPFDATTVDDLFRTELCPKPLAYFRERLMVDEVQLPVLRGLLSPTPRTARPSWTGPGVRLRYFGHACVLIEWNGTAILVDPWIGGRGPGRSDMPRYSFADLPDRIDYALVTHGHHDHFVIESLLRLRHRICHLVVPRGFGLLYADTSLKLAARQLGFRTVTELDTLEAIEFGGGGEIIGVPFLGEHGDLAHGKCAYVVRAGRESVLFAADSRCLDPDIYTPVRASLGEIGMIFLGMECVGAPLSWLYGAFLPKSLSYALDQTRRTRGSGCSEALALTRVLGCRRLLVYAMGQEPWLRYAMGLPLGDDSFQMRESNLLLTEAAAYGIEAERLLGSWEQVIGR
jgi:L-ascorbate metabolism protein UlaG (beta-lactamase superfamily)